MRWTALHSLATPRTLLGRPPSRAQRIERRPAAATPTPIRAAEAGGLELSNLGRYLFVGALVGACMLLSAWSRIDLVETAGDLGSANSQLARAMAERDRLELELATLRDPRHLGHMADNLSLVSPDQVLEVSPLPDGGLIRKSDAVDGSAISMHTPTLSTRSTAGGVTRGGSGGQ